MRIAVVCAGETPVPPRDYGGAERITDAMVWELVNRGHEVDLFAGRGSTCPATRLFIPEERLRSLAAHEPWMVDTVRQRHAGRPYAAVIDSAGTHLASRQPDLPVWARMGGDPFGLFPHDACRNRVYISPEFAAFNGCPNHPVLRNVFCREPEKLPLGDGAGGYALYVGVIHPMKGLILAAEACKQLGMRFVIAGPRRLTYAYLTDELGRRDAECIGPLGADRAERDALFGAASVFLHLTQCIDADPIAPKEAMVYGTPVVASKNGGIASTVEPGISGYFADDVAQVMARIEAALSLDRREVRAAILPQVHVGRYAGRVEYLCRRVERGETW